MKEEMFPLSAAPVVYVPRWRLFAYRAVGWVARGALTGSFVEITWPGPGQPVFLPPCLDIHEPDSSPAAMRRDVA